MMTHATALFADRHTTHAALEQLAQAGFSRDDISLVMSEDTHRRDFGEPRVRQPRPSGLRRVGAAGVLGTIVHGLVVCTTPDGSPLRVGGPLQSALNRPSTLAAVLVALGMAEPAARAADARVRNGAIVVGVEASRERAGLALQLLELSGGATLKAA